MQMIPRTAEERREDYDPRQRFRPYRARVRRLAVGDEHSAEWIAAAGCDSHDGIGVMLTTLAADGEYDRVADAVGILDTGPWAEGQPGSWLINPFGKAKEGRAS